jgi:hypothetical protein
MNSSSLGTVALDRERADVAAVEEDVVHDDTYQGEEEQEVHNPKSQTRGDHTDNVDRVAVVDDNGVVAGHDDAVVVVLATVGQKYLVRALLGAALLEDGETHFDPEKGFDRQPW